MARFGRLKSGLRKIRQSKTARRALGYAGAAAVGYGAYRVAKKKAPGLARNMRRAAVGAGAAYLGHRVLKKVSPKYAKASAGYSRTIRASARLARMRYKNPNALQPFNGPPPLPVGHRRIKRLSPKMASYVLHINHRGDQRASEAKARLSRIQAKRSMTPSQRRRLRLAGATGVTAAVGALNHMRRRIQTPTNIAIKKGYRTRAGKLKAPKLLKHGFGFFAGLAKKGMSRYRRRVRRYQA